MNKNLNLIVSAGALILGAVFVLSDDASINANVIGYSGGGPALASIIGIFLIVLSGAFFIFIASKKDVELERLALHTESKHEDLVKSEIDKQDQKDKYEHKQ